MNGFQLNNLYDSEQHVVVGVQYHDGDHIVGAFELVSKQDYAKVVFLTGDMAIAFQGQINFWQLDPPSQDEVEEVVAAFMLLGQMPLVMH